MDDKTEITGNFIDSLWKFFASVKLTVVVLLSLAVLSIFGTLIPQNASSAEYFRAFGPFFYQLLATLDVFDMYHAWWFQGLMVTLVINIVICSIDRLRVTGKIVFIKTPQFNLQSYRRRKSRLDFKLSGDTEVVQKKYQRFVGKQFRYCRVVNSEQGFAITAEKGRWTRLGVYGVHLSVVLLLIGGVVGSMKGYDGYINVAEGEAVNSIQIHNSSQTMDLPFSIRCDDFDVQFYDTGAPKEFRSRLTILENGEPVLQKDIIVNDPLRYKGINIFQSSYGKLDSASQPASGTKEFELTFRSAASGMLYTLQSTLGGPPVEIPENLGSFEIHNYLPAAEFKGMAVGPALTGTLTPQMGLPQSILLPVKFPKFDTMRKGAVIISVAQGAEMPETRYYTGLQVTRDPGVGLVYTGFTMMILGCIVTFFMSHQQVVVEVSPKGRQLSVMVAGKANKNKVGFKNKLDHLVEKLEALDSGDGTKNG